MILDDFNMIIYIYVYKIMKTYNLDIFSTKIYF